jgi:methionine aminopeptidase
MKTENNMILNWLKGNNNPQIEIKVLNELVDKLIHENKLLKEELEYEKRKNLIIVKL